MNLTHNVPDYDTVYIPEVSRSPGKEAVLSRYARPEIRTSPLSTEYFLSQTRKNLALMTQYIEAMPEVEFVFFTPPFSMLHWDGQIRDKHLDALKAEYAESCRILTDFDNVRLYLWTDDEMLGIMSDLNNYIDFNHYDAHISSEILRRIKNHLGLVTKQDYQAHLNAFFQYVESFDYDSLFV